MPFALRAVRGLWKRMLALPTWLVAVVAAALIQHGVEKQISHPDQGMWAEVIGLSALILAHWMAITGWLIAVNLIVVFIIAYAEEKRAEKIRRPKLVLADYAQKLWRVREEVVLDPDALRGDLEDARNTLNRLRGELLNMVPSVFTPATAEAFRAVSGMISITVANQVVPKEWSLRAERVSLLTDIDHLLNNLQQKWRVSASVSPSPSELVPVRPVLAFNMVDSRFVEEADVLSTLDQRPNLMELSPRLDREE